MEKSEFNILVVDDEVALGEVLVESLDMEDYKADFKISGADALESIKSNPKYHLVICDMNMPGITGLELLNQLHSDSNIQSKPFFFLYTGNIEISKDELQKLGGHEIVSKPFEIDDLVELIDTYRNRLG